MTDLKKMFIYANQYKRDKPFDPSEMLKHIEHTENYNALAILKSILNIFHKQLMIVNKSKKVKEKIKKENEPKVDVKTKILQKILRQKSS